MFFTKKDSPVNESLRRIEKLKFKTQAVLKVLIGKAEFLNDFVLVGGSALALHICHRKSEDLDFFTYSDTFPKEDILKHIHRFDKKRIINETKFQIDCVLDGVKVTLFNADWKFLNSGNKKRFKLLG